MEQITQQLFNLLGTIITVAVAVAVKYIKDYLVLKGGEKAVKITEIVAKNAVYTVEQVSNQLDVHGLDKLHQAKELVIEALWQKGIKLTDDQVTMYIESAVKQANETWNTQD